MCVHLYTLRSKSVTLKLLYSLDKLIRIYYERARSEEKSTNKITSEKEIRTIYLHFQNFKSRKRMRQDGVYAGCSQWCWTLFRWALCNAHNVKSVGVFPSSHNSIGCDCGFACDKHFPNGNVCDVWCWWIPKWKNPKHSIGKLIWFGTKRSGTSH